MDEEAESQLTNYMLEMMINMSPTVFLKSFMHSPDFIVEKEIIDEWNKVTDTGILRLVGKSAKIARDSIKATEWKKWI